MPAGAQPTRVSHCRPRVDLPGSGSEEACQRTGFPRMIGQCVRCSPRRPRSSCWGRARGWSRLHVSNALGTVTPAQETIEMAHRYGAKVLLDGAQAVSHMRTDVQVYDCDFYVFSGHTMFGHGKRGVMGGYPASHAACYHPRRKNLDSRSSSCATFCF